MMKKMITRGPSLHLLVRSQSYHNSSQVNKYQTRSTFTTMHAQPYRRNCTILSRGFQSNVRDRRPLGAAATQGTESPPKEFSEIPGPKAWPLVGNLFYLMLHKDNDPNSRHKMWRSLFDQYGPIVKVSFPGAPQFVASINPDDIETFFKSTMDNPVRHAFSSLKKIRDNDPNNYFQKKAGLLPENGEEWWRLRSRVQGPLLRPKNVSAYLPKVDRATLAYMDRIEMLQSDNGQIPGDFLDDIYRWALECVGLVALNQELGCLEPNLSSDSDQMKMVHLIGEIFYAINQAEMRLPTWKLFRSSGYQRLEASHNAFFEIADKAIQDANCSLEEAKAKGDPNRTLSVMETFLNTEGLSKSDVITMIVDMLVAGVDTTSTAVGFTLYLLAINPDAQRKLQQEVDAVLGNATDLLPDHIIEMTYLNYVVKESLRMYPLALGNARVLTEEIVLSGYKVPAKAVAVGFNILISRDEKYFSRPNDFLPERWARDRPHGPIHPYASLPFSTGKRMCIGKRIAEQEIYTFLIRVMQMYIYIDFVLMNYVSQRKRGDILFYSSPLFFGQNDVCHISFERTMQRYTVTFESTQEMDVKTMLVLKPAIPLSFKFTPRR